MRIVIDIEANSLVRPTNVWVIVTKDLDTGDVSIFRNVTTDQEAKDAFLAQADKTSLWVGHHILGYDLPVLCRLLGMSLPSQDQIVDTLVASKLFDFPRDGHSIEQYGKEFGIEKIPFNNFKEYSIEMEDYCKRDVDITEKVFRKYEKLIKQFPGPLLTEQQFQLKVINVLETNGFYFDSDGCRILHDDVVRSLQEYDKAILEEFPPKEVLVREFVPRATKFGTISLSSIPKSFRDKVHELEVGRSYALTKTVAFNPASHKQIVEVLSKAGWCPGDKTETHKDTENTLNRLKYRKGRDPGLDSEINRLYTRLQELKKTGWKVNENNLNTLPPSAPQPARTLAQRILYESRRRTLSEWLSLVSDDHRIHGRYYGIGAWTHRMSHQAPNTANIPNATKLDGSKQLLGEEMRALWCAPPGRCLVGVDAEGIQLRIFAHYIDDAEFTDALVRGRKEDKTDPHSLNQRILGEICKSRSAAKRFIFALLLGAGLGKLGEILQATREETADALDRLMERYTGFALLKETIIPRDARKGYFLGLDGRPVKIPGDTVGQREHLCMSGYLQNGEAVVMKLATLKWIDKLQDYDAILVNFVHDEWQTETSQHHSLSVAQLQADSLAEVGVELGLKCPLAGSFTNDHGLTIGQNWSITH